MKTSLLTVCVCLLTALAAGCFSAKAPDNIYIGGRSRSPDVDSSTIPRTRTHEEARSELTKAYGRIRYLERKLERCEEKRDECDEKYERLADKYDD